jgi:WD40 repeat protein
LVAGWDGLTLAVWDLRQQQLLAPTVKLADRRPALMFSLDGHWLAIGGENGARLLDVRSGQMLDPRVEASVTSAAAMAFSPDGGLLAVGRKGALVMYDTRTNVSVSLPLNGLALSAVAFTANGSLLATSACLEDSDFGCQRSELRLWDVPSRQPLGSPLGTVSYGVENLGFTGDGNTLLSGNADLLTQWDIDPEAWVRRACRVANRTLTPEEWASYRPDQPYAESDANVCRL